MLSAAVLLMILSADGNRTSSSKVDLVHSLKLNMLGKRKDAIILEIDTINKSIALFDDAILLCITGMENESATPAQQNIFAKSIELNISLRSINILLRTQYENELSQIMRETK